jgi:hypothetical protein
VGLKLIFLIVTRALSLLGMSRRKSWWKVFGTHRTYAGRALAAGSMDEGQPQL